ncbi:MAG TPA: clostripain-related cysteine peptidase [Pyrinomonadaceae bacterium]|jgi:hypothetical protein
MAKAKNGTNGYKTAAAAAASHEAEWTIMIYMAGDNNLADDSIRALTQMRGIQTDDDIHVVAQIDPSDQRVETRRMVLNLGKKKKAPLVAALEREAKRAVKPGKGKEVEAGVLRFDTIKRLEDGRLPPGKRKFQPALDPKRPGAANGNGASPPDDGETDTADPATLFDFISWTKDNLPAKRYMLVLAGHAAGIEDGFLLKDENPPGSMKFAELLEVLRQVRDGLKMKLDILGFDACLMTMAEICHELRGYAELVVGSQGFVPNPGWPYRHVINELRDQIRHGKGGGIEPEDVARMVVSNYINFYLENAVIGGLSVDQAALRTAAAPGVAAAVKGLAEVLGKLLGEQSAPLNEAQRAIVIAHWTAQSYNGELFVDLCDFCEQLAAYLPGNAKLRAALDGVEQAVQEMVVSACFCGIDSQYSRGLSIFFPWSVLFRGYKDLEFAQETGWYDFLLTYLNTTRRPARGAQPDGDLPQVVREIETDRPPFGRKAPPEGHGPSGIVHSMRNPPRRWLAVDTKEAPCDINVGKRNKLMEEDAYASQSVS